jgi:hypothetical protein
MKEYFAAQGIVCPDDANPAEFMIDGSSHLPCGL